MTKDYMKDLKVCAEKYMQVSFPEINDMHQRALIMCIVNYLIDQDKSEVKKEKKEKKDERKSVPGKRKPHEHRRK